MAVTTDHTQQLRIRSTQMEMHTPDRSDRSEDYDRKLRDAQEELERIQEQRQELERKKLELEELTRRKHEFISQQLELGERLSNSITLMDRELSQIHGEVEDIEQCRVCFASNLDKLQKINPESWTMDNLADRLERAGVTLDLALDEYEQAAAHFEGSRVGAVFGRPGKRGRAAKAAREPSEFALQLRNGFAFNLPVLTLGGIALLVYLLK